jgi:hypothetical protein
MFIFSAHAKLKDIEPFEWTIAETGIVIFSASNIISRLLIISEYILGFLILANLSWPRLRRGKLYHITYYAAMYLLAVFNIYLLYILFAYGNNGNCGCFGNMLQFSPMAALFKNLVVMVALDIMHRTCSPHYLSKHWLPYALAVGAFAAFVFWKQPADFMFKKDRQDVGKPYAVNLAHLYNGTAATLPFDSSSGKFILALVSTHCHFCVKAARRLHSMKASHPALPVFMVTKADSASFKKFLQETQAYNIPFQINDSVSYLNHFNDPAEGLPALLWIDGSKVVRKSSYWNLSEQQLVNWSK